MYSYIYDISNKIYNYILDNRNGLDCSQQRVKKELGNVMYSKATSTVLRNVHPSGGCTLPALYVGNKGEVVEMS